MIVGIRIADCHISCCVRLRVCLHNKVANILGTTMSEKTARISQVAAFILNVIILPCWAFMLNFLLIGYG